jgi:hypothetical protein
MLNHGDPMLQGDRTLCCFSRKKGLTSHVNFGTFPTSVSPATITETVKRGFNEHHYC